MLSSLIACRSAVSSFSICSRLNFTSVESFSIQSIQFISEVGMSVVPNVQLSKDRLDALYADIQKLDTAETEVKVRIKPISPLLACHLCSGYLVNATAITECLHVFCRSCLIKHLQVLESRRIPYDIFVFR